MRVNKRLQYITSYRNQVEMNITKLVQNAMLLFIRFPKRHCCNVRHTVMFLFTRSQTSSHCAAGLLVVCTGHTNNTELRTDCEAWNQLMDLTHQKTVCSVNRSPWILAIPAPLSVQFADSDRQILARSLYLQADTRKRIKAPSLHVRVEFGLGLKWLRVWDYCSHSEPARLLSLEIRFTVSKGVVLNNG